MQVSKIIGHFISWWCSGYSHCLAQWVRGSIPATGCMCKWFYQSMLALACRFSPGSPVSSCLPNWDVRGWGVLLIEPNTWIKVDITWIKRGYYNLSADGKSRLHGSTPIDEATWFWWLGKALYKKQILQTYLYTTVTLNYLEIKDANIFYKNFNKIK